MSSGVDLPVSELDGDGKNGTGIKVAVSGVS